MTDLEMIAELRADAQSVRDRCPADCVATYTLKVEHLDRLLTLAETGALLAEVEAKWPSATPADIYIDRQVGWTVKIDTCDRGFEGSGPTFTAALRDLLGVDGG